MEEKKVIINALKVIFTWYEIYKKQTTNP